MSEPLRLIREQIQEFETVMLEDQSNPGKEKNIYIRGIFLQGNIVNRNGRYYPIEVLDKAVDVYREEYINKKRSTGELGHPDYPKIEHKHASHIIESLEKDGNNYIGKARVLTKMPNGQILKSLIEEGIQLGVSSRSLGKLVESTSYKRVDDLRIMTAADIVSDPSGPDCFVDGLMEGREWINVNGVWTERVIEEARQKIANAPSRKLDEAKEAVFKDLLSRLKLVELNTL